MIENIDCIAFKRDCGADPQGIVANTKLLNHQQACAPCADFYQSMLALDIKLNAAFDLPIHEASIEDQLSATQVSGSNVVALKKPLFNRFKPVFAAAASVLVAAFGIFALQYSAPTLANEVVEHIHHEPHLLMQTERTSSLAQIQMVLKQANVRIADENLEILSAKLCPLDGQLAAHLVVKGETGPVTVMILPENNSKAGKIKTNEFNGRIVPAEHGVIAVVGGKKENLANLESAVLNAFHWQD